MSFTASLAHSHGALAVDGHSPVPVLLLQLLQGALHARRGVVDQDVEPPERLRDPREELTYLLRVPQVRTDAEAVHTQGLYLPLRGRGGLVAAEVVEGDVGAPARQLQRHGLPDAARRPRDQRYLTRQRRRFRSYGQSWDQVGQTAMPPSTQITCPVMYLARSCARNATM